MEIYDLYVKLEKYMTLYDIFQKYMIYMIYMTAGTPATLARRIEEDGAQMFMGHKWPC